MVKRRPPIRLLLGALLLTGTPLTAQPGSIRGVVIDKDFDAPVPGVRVVIVETELETETTDQGNYVLSPVPAGRYTLVFSKEGYLRQLKTDVVVSPGQLTDLNVALAGEFTEMDEFVVQDALQLTAGSEAALLQLRFESPALLDSISADLMSRAGASDAAGALRFVPGASLKDGKSAVIRGLPDRYVVSLVNGVRVPTADEDKRAVELDQFPAAVIESIQVSKTFTPDQQGDASGGAVNLLLKGIPQQTFIQFKSQIGFNSQVMDKEDEFLSYVGGGVDFWGDDDGRNIQFDDIGDNWDGAVGVSRRSAPTDYKWSVAGGVAHEFDFGLKLGGFASIFYERDSSFFDDGVDDAYWVEMPGAPLTPRAFQGTVQKGDFKTQLFDVTRGAQEVQWGILATVGAEWAGQSLNLTYLKTRTTDDVATLAEDTRGKEFFFPGFDPDDPTTPGHGEPDAAPYVRLETLQYTERGTGTLQLSGKHVIPTGELELGDDFKFLPPEIDWTFASSFADLDQPDKRQFGSVWFPEREPLPGLVIPATHRPFKPAANFNLGNLQRIWKEIEEDSTQFTVDFKLPFEQWSGEKGALKLGYFSDEVDRTFDQETFSNFGDSGAFFEGSFDEFWSAVFPFEDHPITESTFDVDYDGTLEISAWYAMLELPITSNLRVIGGVRFESTDIGIVNDPEKDATWFPPGATAPFALNPGDADVTFQRDDVLPSIGLEYRPFEGVTVRASYNETVARQTFKELTPILQQEFLGGPIFIGNPELQMSSVKNYDVRVDYTPYEGALISASWFRKDLEDPIEFVQRIVSFDFTTAVNFPEGTLSGFEFEIRQDLGYFWSPLEGLSIGGNATIIDSEVTLPDDEIAAFAMPGINVPMDERDMTLAPEYLLNLYLTYDLAATGTQIALFYTVQGDTLLTGAGQADGNFVPSIYAEEFGTLNLSVSQKIGDNIKLQFKAKNLTNPDIKQVYRSEVTDDVTASSSKKGIDYSFSVSAEFRF